jgi:Tfp pilus assembly protein PilN
MTPPPAPPPPEIPATPVIAGPRPRAPHSPQSPAAATLAGVEAAAGEAFPGAGPPQPVTASDASWAPSELPPPAPPRSPAQRGETAPLNLARRQFVNTRPVVRVAAILWLVGLALLAANVSLFLGYLTASQTSRAKLAGLGRDVERERHDVADLQSRIGTLQLEQQNAEVAFLNRQIDERTFSWSLLFDRMAEVLPDQVRLLQMRPQNVVQKDSEALRSPGREGKPQPLTVTIHGEAKSDEALLRFVDNMFAHPAFSEPNLQSEEREESGLLRFNLVVQYQPGSGVLQGAAPRAAAGTTPGNSAPAATSAGAGAAAAASARPVSPAGAGLVRMAPPPPAPRRPPVRRPSHRAPGAPGAAGRGGPGGAAGGGGR